MTDQSTISRYITLGLLVVLAGTVWAIVLAEQPSLYA